MPAHAPGSRSIRRAIPFIAIVALFAATLLVTAPPGHAQFGAGLQSSSTRFYDPDGLYSLVTPPGWTYQPDHSDAGLAVFYGTGEWDLFFVEVLDRFESTAMLAAWSVIGEYTGGDGLPGFELLSLPSPGTLAGQEAAFVVYSFLESGATITEGRAFVVHGDYIISLAFSDEASRFETVVPLFNSVMQSLELYEPAPSPLGSGTGSGLDFGNLAASAGMSSLSAVGPGSGATSSNSSSANGSIAAATVYKSPDGHFTFAVPDGWELWEEASTRRGDAVEPWHTLLDWPGKPVSKSLFIWDYFDPWTQTGTQYEIVMAVIGDVPGTQAQAVEAFKDQLAGRNALIYTPQAERVRIGDLTGWAVQIVTRPGMVEPWSEGTPWFKSYTFYVTKQGTALFAWAIHNDAKDLPEVAQALDSFRWAARQP